ncbi:MAG TPA: hypothetical protein VFF39_15870, partial [Verrucomicrobiae bacterium]|nr:hypothetical protein [Verrucomicrobiae bacterium]
LKKSKHVYLIQIGFKRGHVRHPSAQRFFYGPTECSFLRHKDSLDPEGVVTRGHLPEPGRMSQAPNLLRIPIVDPKFCKLEQIVGEASSLHAAANKGSAGAQSRKNGRIQFCELLIIQEFG